MNYVNRIVAAQAREEDTTGVRAAAASPGRKRGSKKAFSSPSLNRLSVQPCALQKERTDMRMLSRL